MHHLTAKFVTMRRMLHILYSNVMPHSKSPSQNILLRQLPNVRTHCNIPLQVSPLLCKAQLHASSGSVAEAEAALNEAGLLLAAVPTESALEARVHHWLLSMLLQLWQGATLAMQQIGEPALSPYLVCRGAERRTRNCANSALSRRAPSDA